MKATHPRIPTLLPAQLAALKDGCSHTADNIVRSCEPRIGSLASRYAQPDTDRRDELEQEGRIAASEAGGSGDRGGPPTKPARSRAAFRPGTPYFDVTIAASGLSWLWSRLASA